MLGKQTCLLFLGASLAVMVGAQGAYAAKRQVGTCTNNPLQYSTIQAGVDAAQSGDQVQICPGAYPEEVAVAKAITLTNVPGMDMPTITIPSGGAVQNTTMLGGFPAAAQILVDPSSPVKVTVKNLIVDGAGNNIQTCGLELIGIYYQNAGGQISGDTAQNQLLPSGYQGCQSGEGIFVESQASGTPTITITNNTAQNFDKNGVTVDGAQISQATVSNNTITGLGPTDVIAQNGIQLSDGASGIIKGNAVSNLNYSPGTYGASGIILYDLAAGTYQSPPEVNGNTVTNAQYGVVLDAVGGAPNAPALIKNNQVSGAAFSGVGLYSDYGYLESAQVNGDYIRVAGNVISGTNPYDNIDVCGDNNTVSKNTVSSSAESGIHLDGLCTEADNSSTGVSNTVSSNTITDNCVGILSGPPVGANNIAHNNTFSGNTHNYIYGQDSYSCSPHHKPAKTIGASQPLVHRPLAH